MRTLREFSLFFFRGVVGFFVVGVVLALTQDFQLFPEVLTSLIYKKRYIETPVPDGVERFLVGTEDGRHLETWRLDVEEGRQVLGSVVIFHGNGGTVRQFFPYQQWLRELGYRSWGFDYRGFGLSSGWPSEAGIYKDADAVVKFAAQRDRVSASALTMFGISIGSGPAAYAAAKYSAANLVLLSPYTSITDVVRSNWFFSLYLSVLRYHFPTLDFVRQLKSTCAVFAHGQLDEIIPFDHTVSLEKALPEGVRRILISDDNAGHNDLFYRVAKKLGAALNQCVASKATSPDS